MDYKIKEGSQAPDFNLPGSDGETHRLSDYKGQTVVLYFYPKDDTPGCTLEAKGFSTEHGAYEDVNAVILGVSRDSLDSHDKFIQKLAIPFVLLSDETGEACQSYDVLHEKTMFGKTSVGIVRSTFIITGAGIIQKIYHNPKTELHAQAVLADLKANNSPSS